MAKQEWLEKDFYAVLGVSKTASEDEIRKAYRSLARKHHPDANPDDAAAESRFKDVSEAYSVLSNAEQRAEYDQIRSLAGSGGLGGRGMRFGASGGGGGSQFDISDLLSSIFEQGGPGAGFQTGGPTMSRGGSRQPRKGTDLKTSVTLSFDAAMAGVTVTLRLPDEAVCSVCKGTGAKVGTMPQRCGICDGTGHVNTMQGGVGFGFAEPCPQCAGRGEVISDPCPQCAGTGTEERPRTVKARMPAGVADGQTVRLQGKGRPGKHGGPSGDLFVTVNVEQHEVLDRVGDNLLLTVPITFAEAALGTVLRAPTLDGSVKLKIPSGTESGKVFRVRGRGAPKSGGGNGDLLVTVNIVVPRKLTKTQKKLVNDFAAMDDSDPREYLRAVLDADEEAS